MIKFQKVSKVFKVDFWATPFKALDDLSFHIEEGGLIGFLGANGAGKTTSIKILMNFINKNSGEIIFGNNLGSNKREILSNIGYVPERPYFYPHLTGKEFIYYMGQLSDVSKSLLEARMIKWSERFQIDHALNRKIRAYSKGMLQRVGFVSALIHDPKVLILDEPLSGLDPIGRKEIKDVMLELNKEGKTIFFSSHIVSDVEEICEKIVVIDKGKLIYEGSVEDLIEENMKPDYHIKIKEGHGFKNYVISNENKDHFLKDILDEGGEVISVVQKRPTLEEIVYANNEG